jgi:hypothetical protein
MFFLRVMLIRFCSFWSHCKIHSYIQCSGTVTFVYGRIQFFHVLINKILKLTDCKNMFDD